ncbi:MULTISPECIES: hypothetical protein [Mesorhizobium]|uniref:hypothetical protein n=1 Tax=Mesorhizobium TaxID=68287 RepID=UPI0007A9419E|nr:MULTISPECIES: hypothetical protein [Mesorhizobium]AMX93686.1 hypothetical protein A4R28_11540 [Mesorhizobium ciceri]MDF3208382.1 hypothetical protein [Mesorhizobium sp. LMG15046]MDF3229047.1 hypothetical protein [Mesorhizobium sp. DSM 30133]RUU22161.1 hypothetical protein EOC84_03355 [Mesorhizobium sp. Primo-B]RUU37929.1 hypothetical protein EOC83_16860 [Mesorhizobium sp. Primo-A]
MPKIIAKYTDFNGNVSYVSVLDGHVSHALANGIPYALNSIPRDQDGMSLRFACERCTTVEQLVATISARMYLGGKASVEAFSPATVTPDVAPSARDQDRTAYMEFMLAESFKAWDDEEDSVKEEHADLIAELSDFVGTLASQPERQISPFHENGMKAAAFSAMLKALKGFVDACGGDAPDWLGEEFSACEDAIELAEKAI